MRAVDSHCHLDFDRFDEDREEVIERAKKKLKYVVNAGSNFENNKKVLELSKKHSNFIYPNLGLHPTYTDSFNELEDIKDQIREHNPPAIGEIGLDHHHVTENNLQDRQEEVFRSMLDLAEEMDKPVVIHSRDAEKKAINILKNYNIDRIFLHCFNGSPDLAKEAANNGMIIGVTTQILYSSSVEEIVKELSLENIVLETDSPFLYPNSRNEPVNVLESASKIAEIKNVSKKKVIKKTTQNSKELFMT